MPSQLETIQAEILKRFKRPLNDSQEGQTPQRPEAWHAPMSAPASEPSKAQPIPQRSPYAMPQQQQAPMPQGSASPVPVMTRVNPAELGPAPDPVNPRTLEPTRGAYGDDQAAYRDALQRWKPPHHRGVKQVVGEALIGGANAVNANPNNPWAAVGGLGAGAASGVVQPNVINRNFKLNRANQDIDRQLGEQRTRAQTQALEDRSDQGQQRIDQGDLRIQNQQDRTKGYLAHLETLKGDQKKKLTAELYKSGALNTREGLKYAAEVFGIPVELQEAFVRGEHRDAVDENGNFTDINRRTGKETQVADASGQASGSMAGTMEKGRNTRQAKSLAMQASQIAAANSRDAANRGDRQTARQLDRVSKAAKIHGDLLAGREMQNSKDSATVANGKAIEAQARKALAGYGDVYEVDASGDGRSRVGGDVSPSSQSGASKGKFDRNKYVQTFQRLHKGTQPSQEQIEQAETMWTNP